MKKMINIGMAALLCFTMTATFTGCKKAEKGDKGETGATGPAGADGVANIQHYYLDIEPTDWIYTSTYKRWYFRYPLLISSQSAVLTYVMSGSGYQAIPYHQNFPEDIQFDMASNLFATSPYLEFQFTNYASFTTTASYTRSFYIIAMPPAMIAAHPEVDFKNCEDVKHAFNLK